DVKKAMIQASEKVAVLAISEKLDNAQKIRIAPINDIDYLITELEPGDPLLGPYKTAGIQVI
ncbi:MAG: DeoR family transcriptional regulator, partial [Phaeodactylibacter sp.]|nr:DeoR family transcriptional regulator [Phaeodactylibacter sp.]